VTGRGDILEALAGPPPELDATRAIDGVTFLEQAPGQVPAIWGHDGEGILWAEGEPLMLVGPDGVGKTSLGQQLLLERIGIGHGKLLGLPVREAAGRVLYIAADRPRQAASSLRRMVGEHDYDVLRERLVVWRGPLPFDLAHEREGLVELASALEVSDVFIDSLKDIAVDLTKDETGSRVGVAFQSLIASGRELAVSHHQRKELSGAGKPKRLTDVYGSRWLTAGMGSVVLLWGEPGDLVVELRHLKQPAEEVGPLTIVHDHVRGRSSVDEGVDLEQMLVDASHGVTVQDVASRLFGTSTPTRNEIEKARRKLEGLVKRERAQRRDDPDGLARYFHPEKTP
jgi:replicative DNA helicase